MMPLPRNKRPLTELELEEIALNLDLDQSDDDENEVDLGLENVVPDPDDIEIADNMSDSWDEEPLAHYIPGYQKKWPRTRQFEPSQFNFQDKNIDTELEQPIAYLNKYVLDRFFEDVALFTNMREVADKGTRHKSTYYFRQHIPKSVFPTPIAPKTCGNQKVSKGERNLDKLDTVQKGCRNNKRTRYVSIDEQMIPFHGQVEMRQFVRGKPNLVGLKNFVMTTPKGVPSDFYLYEGKGSSVDSCLVNMPEKLDVGGRMVLKLTETLPIGVSVYTDRYFTSISLIDSLSSSK
ncbi:hypothetical protein JTB14_029539 [Gonioctena quinquepunctata]|nr:hypothetical protein JTB14_029539 [Gonioctena quinquepunctata]